MGALHLMAQGSATHQEQDREAELDWSSCTLGRRFPLRCVAGALRGESPQVGPQIEPKADQDRSPDGNGLEGGY